MPYGMVMHRLIIALLRPLLQKNVVLLMMTRMYIIINIYISLFQLYIYISFLFFLYKLSRIIIIRRIYYNNKTHHNNYIYEKAWSENELPSPKYKKYLIWPIKYIKHYKSTQYMKRTILSINMIGNEKQKTWLKNTIFKSKMLKGLCPY